MLNETEFNKALADRINHHLSRNGWNQKALAEKLGVSTSIVSNWCKGLNTPRMDKIDGMCRLFNCARNDLIPEDAREPEGKEEAVPALPEDAERAVLVLDLFREIENADMDTLRRFSQILAALKK